MRYLLAIFIAASTVFSASAQSPPNPAFYYNFIPSAAQWNSYFAAKQDYLGYTPMNPNGTTMTGRLVLPAPSATLSGFNLTPGSTPSAPVNGDIWPTTSGLFARVNGVTYKINQNGASLVISASGVNFNAVADTVIPVLLPPWATRYLVSGAVISGASVDVTTAQVGMFTAAAASGVTLVAGATAVTVASASDATNNNAQTLTVTNAATRSFLLAGQPSIYFRVTTGEGSAATANVSVTLTPLP